MTAYRERGTDRLHLVDAEPAEVGITILCGPKRTPEEVKARQMQLMQ